MEQQARIDELAEDAAGAYDVAAGAEREVLDTLLRTSSVQSVQSNHYLSPVQRAAGSPTSPFSPSLSRAASMRVAPIHEEVAALNADAHAAAAFLQKQQQLQLLQEDQLYGPSVALDSPTSATASPKQNYAPKFKFKPAVLRRAKSEAVHPYHWL